MTTWSTAAPLTVGFYAVPITLDVKGLVWYPAPEFEQAGYTVPTTWSELISLSERIVADGRTPWCMGWENGATSGSPGTDWIEGLLLRWRCRRLRPLGEPRDPRRRPHGGRRPRSSTRWRSATTRHRRRRLDRHDDSEKRHRRDVRTDSPLLAPVSGQRVAGPSATGRQARRRHVILPAPAATSRECCSALRRRHVRSGLHRPTRK